MNSPSHLDPDDPEQLLRSGLRETTPEFEKRWADLKRELRQEPVPHRAFPTLKWFWLLAPVGASMIASFILFTKPSGPSRTESGAMSPTTIAVYGELLDLDSALRDAMPLTNTENLETLLNLPLSNGHRS